MPTSTTSTVRHTVRNGDAELYVEQRGSGPDVLLLCGLGDTVEAWSNQFDGLGDRYRVTSIDNRGAGRSPLPASGITVPLMASDAAAVIRALDLGPAHVAGFSGGGMIAQRLAIDEPELVRSLVLNGTFARFSVRTHRLVDAWLALAEHAPSPRTFLEWFLAAIYTDAAHEDGRVEAWIQEFLDFPYPMSDEVFAAQVEAWRAHDTSPDLPGVTAPTLVIAGEHDQACPPPMSRAIADAIPGAELVVMADQAHQPFQEAPGEWNALVDDFLRRVG